MKNALISIFILFMVLPVRVSAEVTPVMQRRCGEMFLNMPVDIEINYDLGELKYDTSKSNDDLAKLFSEHNNGNKAENTVNGLTVQNGYFRLTMDIENRTIVKGYKCYYPAKISIDTGFKDSTIYLAKSLRSGTCRFELTKRHEYTHLALGKAGLLAQVQLMQRLLPTIIKKQGAMVSDEDKEQIERKIFDAYNKEINDLRLVVAGIMTAEQQKLDNKQNYLRETALCP